MAQHLAPVLAVVHTQRVVALLNHFILVPQRVLGQVIVLSDVLVADGVVSLALDEEQWRRYLLNGLFIPLLLFDPGRRHFQSEERDHSRVLVEFAPLGDPLGGLGLELTLLHEVWGQRGQWLHYRVQVVELLGP